MNGLKLIGKTTIGRKQFNMNDSRGTVQKTKYGLPDHFYGGMLKEFRKTDYGILLCLDKKDRIINLAYVEDELTDAGRKLLGLPDQWTHMQSEGMKVVMYSEKQDGEFFGEVIPEIKESSLKDDTAEEIEKMINNKSRKR